MDKLNRVMVSLKRSKGNEEIEVFSSLAESELFFLIFVHFFSDPDLGEIE
jgi:hypothetical protein